MDNSMSTTADRLNYLENTKLAIKQALTDKGVTVSDSDTFRSYANKIDEIQSGGTQIFYTDEPAPTSPSYNKIINTIKKIDLSQMTEITLGHLFEYCSGLEEIIWPSNLKKMLENKAEMYTYYTFRDCSSLKSIDLSNFYTGNSHSMTYMFYGCSNLTSLNLSTFDTSKVTDMAYIFGMCLKLTSLDISTFDTSNVKNMTYMFYGCSNLTSLNLSTFDTSEVIYITCMFYGCSNLTSLNLSTFDTSKVTSNSMMFNSCNSLTNVVWGNNWASNSAITSFDVSPCPLSHDSCLDLFNKLATKSSNATLQLSTTTKGYMSEEEIAIATNKGWTVS